MPQHQYFGQSSVAELRRATSNFTKVTPTAKDIYDNGSDNNIKRIKIQQKKSHHNSPVSVKRLILLFTSQMSNFPEMFPLMILFLVIPGQGVYGGAEPCWKTVCARI